MKWKEFVYKVDKNIRGIYLKGIYHRHFSPGGKLIADRGCRLILKNGSMVEIGDVLKLNENCMIHNGRTTILRLDENAKFLAQNTSIYYGGDIIVFKDGILKIGNSFINSDCRIRCHQSITIGDGCAISHELTIMDSDAHALNGERHTAPVTIGNHVWIGTHVTILSGVTVGDGAVIAAGALVKENVPAGCLVAGVPAKAVKEKVDWEI